MKVCDDCFEEYTGRKCPTCNPTKTTYTRQQCADAWKIVHVRGFKDQDEIDTYQEIKKDYKTMTRKDLPTVKEIIKGVKNG